MPSLDAPDHPLVDALQEAFSSLVTEGAIDIVVVEEDAEQDACEVQADDWTLHVEGWPMSTAWIALDLDVTSPEEFRSVLEGVLSEEAIKALSALDESLAGDLARTLAESGDDLSIALAALIEADVEDEDESNSQGD